MSEYDRLIETLLKNMRSAAPTHNVENVVIDLLKKNDLRGAISLIEKTNPNPAFASAFANGLLQMDDETLSTQFISLKKIAGENITAKEADIILARYTGPDGKNRSIHCSAPAEILQASSKEAMMIFFEFVIEDRKYSMAQQFWPFLKDKI